MSETIRDRLVRRGKDKYKKSSYFVEFSGESAADGLVNDLKQNPHAFVIACIMNRQIKPARAWQIPYRLSRRLGGFDFDSLSRLSLEEIERAMSEPEPLHRFAAEMSRNLFEAIRHIEDRYQGDASRVWSDRPSSGELVCRFLEFRGVGPRIANAAANTLARRFRVRLSDYCSVDVSVDAHVRRVFERLGLVPPRASVEQVVFRARSLNPEFPGLLNLPAWEIGHAWCLTGEPLCRKCFMEDLCPTAAELATDRSG